MLLLEDLVDSGRLGDLEKLRVEEVEKKMSCRNGKCISKSRELRPSYVRLCFRLMIGTVCMLQQAHINGHVREREYCYNFPPGQCYNPLSPTTPTMTVISSLISSPPHRKQRTERRTIFFPSDKIYSLLNSSLHKWTNSSSLLTNLPSFRT
jgi:hypothetical protein